MTVDDMKDKSLGTYVVVEFRAVGQLEVRFVHEQLVLVEVRELGALDVAEGSAKKIQR